MKLSLWFQSAKLRLSHHSDGDEQVFRLVEKVLSLNRSQVIQIWGQELSQKQIQHLNLAVISRSNGRPLQYLLGVQEFAGHNFEVGDGVLIPRPETEVLVNVICENFKTQRLKVAELGAGSGNVGISVLLKRNSWEWHGVECNHQAIAILKRNAQTLLPQGHSYWVEEGNFFNWISQDQKWDLIVSNPPYVKTADFAKLSPEVLQEPRIALDGGEDGLRVIQPLIEISTKALKSDGALVFEIGSDQGQSASDLVQRHFTDVQGFADNAGHPRVIFAKTPKS